MDEDKWIYVNKIRNYKENRESILCDLLDTYGKYGIRDITCSEVKEYYEKLLKENEGI